MDLFEEQAPWEVKGPKNVTVTIRDSDLIWKLNLFADRMQMRKSQVVEYALSELFDRVNMGKVIAHGRESQTRSMGLFD